MALTVAILLTSLTISSVALDPGYVGPKTGAVAPSLQQNMKEKSVKGGGTRLPQAMQRTIKPVGNDGVKETGPNTKPRVMMRGGTAEISSHAAVKEVQHAQQKHIEVSLHNDPYTVDMGDVKKLVNESADDAKRAAEAVRKLTGDIDDIEDATTKALAAQAAAGVSAEAADKIKAEARDKARERKAKELLNALNVPVAVHIKSSGTYVKLSKEASDQAKADVASLKINLEKELEAREKLETAVRDAKSSAKSAETHSTKAIGYADTINTRAEKAEKEAETAATHSEAASDQADKAAKYVKARSQLQKAVD